MSGYNNTTNIDDDSKRVKLILQFQEEKPCTFFLNQTLFNNLQYLTRLIILWPKEHMICNKRQIDSYHKEPMLKDSKRRALGGNLELILEFPVSSQTVGIKNIYQYSTIRTWTKGKKLHLVKIKWQMTVGALYLCIDRL